MDSCARLPDAPDPDAVAFVRFCRGRRRVCWPELYDEMWAVASRGLFRGWGFGELEGRGVEFGLFQMPKLAALVARVIGEEPHTLPIRRAPGAGAQRRGLAVMAETVGESPFEPENPGAERDDRPAGPGDVAVRRLVPVR